MTARLFFRSACVITFAILLISCGAPAAVPVATSTVTAVKPTVVSTSTPRAVATETATSAPQLALAWKLAGDPNPFKSPVGIAVDAQGNVYVMDAANYRVQKFDSQGQFLSMWGSKGSGDGQFLSINNFHPVGYVAVDQQNNIYVIDAQNFRIQKFDSNGTYQTQWGSEGAGDVQFELPLDIAIDKQNNIYVGDYQNSTVQKFDSTGKLLLRWGTSGHKDGQFAGGIFSVATDPDGNILVGEEGGRVQRFDSNGNFISKLPLDPVDDHSISPWNIAVDKQGNIYIVDNGFRIVKVDPQGKFLATWSPPELGPIISRNLIDMTVDGQGNIYLVDTSANTVYKFRQPGFQS